MNRLFERKHAGNRRAQRGNALAEYALPMAVILLTCGVMATLLDIPTALRDYFLAASSHTGSAVSGSTFKVETLGGAQLGKIGDGKSGFKGDFGKVKNPGDE